MDIIIICLFFLFLFLFLLNIELETNYYSNLIFLYTFKYKN